MMKPAGIIVQRIFLVLAMSLSVPTSSRAALGSTRTIRQMNNIRESNKQSHRATSPKNVINVLVCLVQWSDHDDRSLVDADYFREMWNGESNTSVNPGESIKNWMESNSYGKYSVQADVVDWYRVDQSEAYWSQGNMGNSVDGSRTIDSAFIPVLEAAIESGINLRMYDNDGSGDLKGIVFVHSGFAAELGGTDCYTGANYMDRIASKPWKSEKEIESFRLESFVTVSAYNGLCVLNPAQIGVHIHEWLHSQFNLFDLFDNDGPYKGSRSAVGGLGAYDIMSFPGGQSGWSAYPGILSPFNKIEIGFNPIEITESGVFTARASALYPDIYMISDPYPSGEYLLIENRQPVLSDEKLWQPGGILIYHIDENVEGGGNRFRGGPFVDGWPGNGLHYKVALLQADGEYELEKALNQGHIGDFWKVGQRLGPGNGELQANSATYPNTDSYVGGKIYVTGLVIDDFKETEEGVWSFRVNNLVPFPPTLSPTKAPTQSVNCYGPLFNDPEFTCNCMDDCFDSSNFICQCEEAEACCKSYSSITPAPTTTPSPTLVPTKLPSEKPSTAPSSQPSAHPSSMPSSQPSVSPSLSQIPSDRPSSLPSNEPSSFPSFQPSVHPSDAPSISLAPSDMPSMSPTIDPSMPPSHAAAIAMSVLFAIGLIILCLYGYPLAHRRRNDNVEKDGILLVPDEKTEGLFMPEDDFQDGLSTLDGRSYLSWIRYWGYPQSLSSSLPPSNSVSFPSSLPPSSVTLPPSV